MQNHRTEAAHYSVTIIIYLRATTTSRPSR